MSSIWTILDIFFFQKENVLIRWVTESDGGSGFVNWKRKYIKLKMHFLRLRSSIKAHTTTGQFPTQIMLVINDYLHPRLFTEDLLPISFLMEFVLKANHSGH